MSYIKSIVRAFKNNRKVLYKLVSTFAIMLSLTYLPPLMLIYLIRTLCIGFLVMSLITLVYIGIQDTQVRKKKKETSKQIVTITLTNNNLNSVIITEEEVKC